LALEVPQFVVPMAGHGEEKAVASDALSELVPSGGESQNEERPQEAKKHIATLEAKIEMLIREASKEKILLEAKGSKQSARISELEAKLGKMTFDNQELERQLDDADENGATMEEAAQILNDAAEAARQSFVAAEASRKSAEAKLEAAKAQIRQLKTEQETACKEVEAAVALAEKEANAAREGEQLREALAAELQEQRLRADGLEERLREKDEKRKAAVADREHLQKEVKSCREQQRHFQKRFEEDEGEKRRLSQQATNAKAEVERLKKEARNIASADKKDSGQKAPVLGRSSSLKAIPAEGAGAHARAVCIMAGDDPVATPQQKGARGRSRSKGAAKATAIAGTQATAMPRDCSKEKAVKVSTPRESSKERLARQATVAKSAGKAGKALTPRESSKERTGKRTTFQSPIPEEDWGTPQTATEERGLASGLLGALFGRRA